MYTQALPYGGFNCSCESSQCLAAAVFTEPLWKARFVLVTSTPVIWNCHSLNSPCCCWKHALTTHNLFGIIWSGNCFCPPIASTLRKPRSVRPATSHQSVLWIWQNFPCQFFPSISLPCFDIVRAVLTLCKPTVNVRSAMPCNSWKWKPLLWSSCAHYLLRALTTLFLIVLLPDAAANVVVNVLYAHI